MSEGSALHILIIKAGFYKDIADMLVEGAVSVLARHGAKHTVVEVPGALEIPVALSLACRAGKIPVDGIDGIYDGVVALGCVIRGETTHYETVSNESTRGLMNLAIDRHVPLGNGILTVETREQALARLKPGENHKGEQAAEACLNLVEYLQTLTRLA